MDDRAGARRNTRGGRAAAPRDDAAQARQRQSRLKPDISSSKHATKPASSWTAGDLGLAGARVRSITRSG
jgi:hypothetical protein